MNIMKRRNGTLLYDDGVDALIDRSITRASTQATTIRAHAFRGCTQLKNVNAPNASTIGQYAFYGCTSLTDLVTPDFLMSNGAMTITGTTLSSYVFSYCGQITSLTITVEIPWQTYGTSTFQNCTGLTSVNAPNLTQLRGKIFNGCSSLKNCNFPKVIKIEGDQVIEKTAVETLVFPAFTGAVYSNALRYNTSLTAVDLNACTSLNGNCFYGCTALATLIIRGNSVPTMGNINSLTNTPFASGGSGGTLYVPSAMISNYQAAANWSTILGYSTNSIAAIEGSEYEHYYADGTPISA